MSGSPESDNLSPQPDWGVSVGPFGRGDCAVKVNGNGTTDVIAPPGVPLMKGPQLVRDLLQWRFAQFADGEVSEPINISLEEAVVLEPDRAPWIVEQQLIQEMHDDAASAGEFPG